VLVGRLVHRAWQGDLDAGMPATALAAAIDTLLAADERAEAGETGPVVDEAARAYRAFRERDDVRALLADGVADHEVPFSLVMADGRIARGAIDCLVRRASGATVIELKTGAPAPEHEAQLALYVHAAAALSGDLPVTGRLIYV
jgi:hypothetical protein